MGLRRLLHPVHAEAGIVPHVYLTSIDGEVVTVAVRDVEQTLRLRETLYVANGEAQADMTVVVGLPVLHEEANILDVNTRARDLPQPGVRRSATSARVALVTRLLEELATKACTKFSDFVGLLTLVGAERTAAATNPLLSGGAVFLGGGWRDGLLDDCFGVLGRCVGGTLASPDRWRHGARST